MEKEMKAANWIARVTVALVFIDNVYCALLFLFAPANMAVAYGFSSTTPQLNSVISGMGVAFLMWNATYPLVIVNARKHKTLFAIVLVQQLIGLLGESFILWRLLAQGGGTLLVAGGIERFIAFDAAGLVLMLAAFIFLLVMEKREKKVSA